MILLTYVTPAMFNRRTEFMPLDSRWFDVTVWGGVLTVTAYAMGTLNGRNQKSLKELKDGYNSATRRVARLGSVFRRTRPKSPAHWGSTRKAPKTSEPQPCCGT